jgi:hypothetical protein
MKVKTRYREEGMIEFDVFKYSHQKGGKGALLPSLTLTVQQHTYFIGDTSPALAMSFAI